MKFYRNLNDFVTAVRSGPSHISASNALFNSEAALSKSAEVDLPKEGKSAILSGFHVYAMLQMKPMFTTTSVNSERQRNISILGALIEGIREISHRYEGALLEAQGPVVHIFIPDDQGIPRDARAVGFEIQEFINDEIKHKAGTDFLKSVVAYCHGPTILVNAEDSHGDESIVSLAPAANVPAKVLWKEWEQFPSGAIAEVNLDSTYSLLDEAHRTREMEKSASGAIFNASRADRRIVVVEASAVPPPDSPDGPTIADPFEYFAISFRADIEGFTKQVSEAFNGGEDDIEKLASNFYEIMAHARTFCAKIECLHLPWAGDCFNLLLAYKSREDYQQSRHRLILVIILKFQEHMEQRFPDLEWAFSIAGGDLAPAQICNTLVSRLTVGHTTLLLATGLPVERSLQGLVRESPDAGRGVLWKGDVAQLDSDLQEIFDDSAGGANYRHFAKSDLQEAQEAHDFSPPPAPYISKAVPATVAAAVTSVKPFFDSEHLG